MEAMKEKSSELGAQSFQKNRQEKHDNERMSHRPDSVNRAGAMGAAEGVEVEHANS